MSEAGDDVATAAPLPIDMLPWHDQARNRLGAAREQGRFPHALLLHGPAGVGKDRFAAAAAAALFCVARAATFRACGECAECSLSRAGTHPDLHWLRPLEDKKSIAVEQVREACEQLGMTSMRGGHRVAIVSPAQAMTNSAQNALLKTLEEPAPGTVLVLVTARPSGLRATLRSRCLRVEIARPPTPVAHEWLAAALATEVPPGLLAIAGGTPLRALELAPHFAGLQDQMGRVLGDLLDGRIEVTHAAQEMMGDGLPVRLDWIEAWLGGLLRQRTLPAGTCLTVPGGPVLQRLAGKVNISAAFRVLDRLRDTRRLLEGPAAAQLAVEALLIDLEATFGRGGVV